MAAGWWWNGQSAEISLLDANKYDVHVWKWIYKMLKNLLYEMMEWNQVMMHLFKYSSHMQQWVMQEPVHRTHIKKKISPQKHLLTVFVSQQYLIFKIANDLQCKNFYLKMFKRQRQSNKHSLIRFHGDFRTQLILQTLLRDTTVITLVSLKVSLACIYHLNMLGP